MSKYHELTDRIYNAVEDMNAAIAKLELVKSWLDNSEVEGVLDNLIDAVKLSRDSVDMLYEQALANRKRFKTIYD